MKGWLGHHCAASRCLSSCRPARGQPPRLTQVGGQAHVWLRRRPPLPRTAAARALPGQQFRPRRPTPPPAASPPAA
eukprot:scaffold53827_cov46-Prasinocladus_malaysianus.AAC.7